jgi:hypothetical protein
LQDSKTQEWFVSHKTERENNEDGVTIGVKRIFDWKGRTQARDWKTYDKAKDLVNAMKFREFIENNGGEWVETEDRGEMVRGNLQLATSVIIPSAAANAVSTATRTATASTNAAKETNIAKWVYGNFKSAAKWANQMAQRGWTEKQITEAITKGNSFKAVNNVNKAHSATRYVHPTTGQSVVIDDVTKELLQVGGKGFLW